MAVRQLTPAGRWRPNEVFLARTSWTRAVEPECLRLVYRLLFMFYIEARPELGYVPIRTSESTSRATGLESYGTWS